MDLDARVRVAAFNFLADQTRLLGEVLPRTLLAQGFPFEGTRVRLLGPHQGIFKPAILPELPLTITTVPIVEGQERPYVPTASVLMAGIGSVAVPTVLNRLGDGEGPRRG